MAIRRSIAIALVAPLSSLGGVHGGAAALATITVAAPARVAPVEALEATVIERVNAIRRGHRLEALRADPVLARVARAYACRIGSEHFFAHRSPGGEGPADRVRRAGLRFAIVGENLAMNENAGDPVAAAIEGWMRSREHRENILRPEFTETGVGVCRRGDAYYFTQLFLRPP